MNSLREFDETYEGTVLGVDEAGRGPLAGAVVAGAVIIPEYFLPVFPILLLIFVIKQISKTHIRLMIYHQDTEKY